LLDRLRTQLTVNDRLMRINYC